MEDEENKPLVSEGTEKTEETPEEEEPKEDAE